MGNRTQVSVASGTSSVATTTSVPNSLNQLSNLTTTLSNGPTTSANLSHDPAGNLTQVLNNDGTRTVYFYDDADRLNRIERRNTNNNPIQISEFAYDYASRCAWSREYVYMGGTTWQGPTDTRRVFDGMDVIQERLANNNVTAQLVRDGNIGGILSRTTTAGVAFYGYDGNGNVTLLTNSAGQDVGHYRYDAFGNTLEAEGPRAGENPYRFSTKELHGPSGLYDYGFRFYSPGLGRWMNRDPLEEEGGVNLYGAMGNNAVNNVDEYGLVWLDNLIDGGKRWVNDQLFGKPKNYSSDADGEVQRAVDANAQVKQTGPKVWKVGAEVVMAAAPVPVPRGLSSASNIAHQAHNAANYARYLNHHRQIKKYGQAGFKTLKNGRILYFGKLKPAKTAGEMAGMRVVREWNPLTGRHRTWMQTLDHAGRVRQVRPQTGNIKVHYRFNIHGKYIGKW